MFVCICSSLHVQIPISHCTDPHITLYRSPYHTVQIPISHCTDPHITLYRSPYHTVQIPISHCTDPHITLYRPTIHISLCADNINTRGVVFVGTCHGRCQRGMGIQGSQANHETPLPTGMSTAVSEWVTHGDDP